MTDRVGYDPNPNSTYWTSSCEEAPQCRIDDFIPPEEEQSVDLSSINPPLDPTKISPAKTVGLNFEQAAGFMGEDSDYELIEARFFPRPGINKETILSAFGVTDPERVKEAKSIDEEIYIMENKKHKYLPPTRAEAPKANAPKDPIEEAPQCRIDDLVPQEEQSVDLSSIDLPLDPAKIPLARIARLNFEQAAKIMGNDSDYEWLEVRFFPRPGINKETILSAFGITDPGRVKEAKSIDDEIYIVEYKKYKYLPLTRAEAPKADAPKDEIEEAKQKLMLEVAGVSDPADLEKGDLMIEFTTDDSGQQIEDYIIYWDSDQPVKRSGAKELGVKAIAYRVNGKEGFSEEIKNAKDYIISLQKLLKLNGYLPLKKASSGRLGEQEISNSWAFTAKNPVLFQTTSMEESGKTLDDLKKQAEKTVDTFLSLTDNKDVPDDLTDQVLAGTSKQALGIVSRLQLMAEQSKDAFSKKKNKNDEELKAFIKKCEGHIKYAEKWIANLLAGENPYIYSLSLDFAENQLKTYLEAKTKGKEAHWDAVNAYKQAYQRIHEYEKEFWWVPGIKEKCEKMRANILNDLEAKHEKYEKKDNKKAKNIVAFIIQSLEHLKAEYKIETPDLRERMSLLLEWAPDLLPRNGSRAAETDIDKASDLKYVAGNARLISEEILVNKSASGAHPARMLIISFFSMLLNEEEKVPLKELFDNFSKLVEAFEEDPKALDALGKYLWADNLYREKRLPDKKIREKTQSFKNRASRALNKLEEICKPKNKNKIKDRQKSGRLKGALQAMLRIFYRQQLTHNAWAKAQGKETISYSDLSQIGHDIVDKLPAKEAEVKMVFQLLSEVPEDPALARNELARKLKGKLTDLERNKTFEKLQKKASPQEKETDPLSEARSKAKKFSKKAQRLNLGSSAKKMIALDSTRGLQAVPYRDLETFLKMRPDDEFKTLSLRNLRRAEETRRDEIKRFGLDETEGYYFSIIDEDAPEGPQFIFQEAPVSPKTTVYEADFGGLIYKLGPLELIETCGAALINVFQYGKAPATGLARVQNTRTLTNALDHNGITGLKRMAEAGDYEIRGSIKYLGTRERAAIGAILSYFERLTRSDPGKKHALSKTEVELAKKLLGQGETFKADERPAIKKLCQKLEKLAKDLLEKKDDNSILTHDQKMGFQRAAFALRLAEKDQLDRKGGLNPDEVSILSDLNWYMEEYGILITDGRFIYKEPHQKELNKIEKGIRKDYKNKGLSKEELDKKIKDEKDKFKSHYRKCLPILRKVHYHLQKLTQYAPEERGKTLEELAGSLGKWYGHLWDKALKAANEVVSPAKIQLFQLPGLPPMKTLAVKYHLFPDKVEKLAKSLKLKELLEKGQDDGAAALNKLNDEQMTQLIKLFSPNEKEPISKRKLEQIFESVKDARKNIEDFKGILTEEEFVTLSPNSKLDAFVKKHAYKYSYNKKNRKLIAKGKMTNEERDKLLKIYTSPAEQKAVNKLYESSKDIFSLRSLKIRLKEEIIRPADKDLEKKGMKMEGISDLSKAVNNEDIALDDTDASNLQSDYNGQRSQASQLSTQLSKIKRLGSLLASILRFEKAAEENPVELLASLEQLENALYSLMKDHKGIFDLGEMDDNDLGEDISRLVGKAYDATLKLRDSRQAYQRWAEVRQQVVMEKEDLKVFFQSDKISREDFEKLQTSEFKKLLEDQGIVDTAVSIFGRSMVQHEKHIYGIYGKEAGLTPKQAMERFFYAHVRLKKSELEENKDLQQFIDNSKGKYKHDRLLQSLLVKGAMTKAEKQELLKIWPAGKETIEHLSEQSIIKEDRAISLSLTIPEVGEPLETTYAKIAITKVYEGIPQPGKFNGTMPFLLLFFGGHGGVNGIFNATREAAVFLDRRFNWNEMSYGAEGVKDAAEIVNNPLKLAEYYLLQGISLPSNQSTPKMPMASQLHYLMIYSPFGTEYLERKWDDAQRLGVDLGKVLEKVNKKDIEEFARYIKEKIIPDIQQNPRLLRQIAYLVDPNNDGDHADSYISSELFRKVVKDTNAALFSKKKADKKADKKDYSKEHLSLEKLAPKASLPQLKEGIELLDPKNEKTAEPLARILQDMFMINTEINMSRGIEDFSKQGPSSTDFAGRLREVFAPREEQKESLEHAKVLQVDPEAEAGDIEEANFIDKGIKSGREWLKIYAGEQMYSDVKELAHEGIYDREAFLLSMEKIAREGGEGLSTIVTLGTMMPRNISAGFGDMWASLLAYITADNEKDKGEALKALHEAIVHTAVAFSIYESFGPVFFLSIKDHLEHGLYGLAIVEAILIQKMFGPNMAATKAAAAHAVWPVENGKLAVPKGIRNTKRMLWDRIIKRKSTPYEQASPLAQQFHRATGIKFLKFLTLYSPFKTALNEVASMRTGEASPIRVWVSNKVGGVQISVSPANIEVYEGTSTGAKVVKGVLNQVLYAGRVKTNLYPVGASTALQLTKHGVKGAVAAPFVELGGKILSRWDTPQIQEKAAIETIQMAKAFPGESTPVMIQRSGGQDTPLIFKNTDFYKMITSGRLANFWHYFKNIRGISQSRIDKQFEELRKIYRENPESFSNENISELLKDKPARPGKSLKLTDMMHEIASPLEVGVEKLYPVLLDQRIGHLRGDQIARIVDAHLHGRSLDFVGEMGITQQEAASFAQRVVGEFDMKKVGPSGMKRLQSWLKTALKCRIIPSGPSNIPLTGMSQGSEHLTTRNGKVIPVRSMTALTAEQRLALYDHNIKYVIVDHELTHADKEPTLTEEQWRVKSGEKPITFEAPEDKTGAPKALRIYQNGNTSVMGANERFADAKIAIEGKPTRRAKVGSNKAPILDSVLAKNPAALEKFIHDLNSKKVGRITFKGRRTPLSAQDLELIVKNIKGKSSEVAVKMSRVSRKIVVKSVNKNTGKAVTRTFKAAKPKSAQPEALNPAPAKAPAAEAPRIIEPRPAEIFSCFEILEQVNSGKLSPAEAARRLYRSGEITLASKIDPIFNEFESSSEALAKTKSILHKTVRGEPISKPVETPVSKNGIESSEVTQWIDSLKTTKGGNRYLRSVMEFAKASGIKINSTRQLAELLTNFEHRAKALDTLTPKQIDRLLKKLSEKIQVLAVDKGEAWMKKTVQGQEFTRLLEMQQEALIKKSKRVQTNAELMGLGTGMATILLADELADILGIENQTLRFAFVLSSAHFTCKAATPLFVAKTRGKALDKMKKALDRLPHMSNRQIFGKLLSKPTMRFLGHEAGTMLRGATYGVTLATGYDALMSIWFEPDSRARDHLVNMGVTFPAMWAFEKFIARPIKANNPLGGGARALRAGGTALNFLGGVMIAEDLALECAGPSRAASYQQIKEKYLPFPNLPSATIFAVMLFSDEAREIEGQAEINADQTWESFQKYFVLHEKPGLDRDVNYYTEVSYKQSDTKFAYKYFSKPIFLSKEMAELANAYTEALKAEDTAEVKKILKEAEKCLTKERQASKTEFSRIGNRELDPQTEKLAEVFDIYYTQQALLSAYENDGEKENYGIKANFTTVPCEYNFMNHAKESSFYANQKALVLRSDRGSYTKINPGVDLQMARAETFLYGSDRIFQIAGWNGPSKSTKLGEKVLAARAEQRMHELFDGALKEQKLAYNQTDIEMGFVVGNAQNGYKLHEENRAYVAVQTKYFGVMREVYLAAKETAQAEGATGEDFLAFKQQEDIIKSLVIDLQIKGDDTSEQYIAALTGTDSKLGSDAVLLGEIKALQAKAKTDVFASIELAAKMIKIKEQIEITA